MSVDVENEAKFFAAAASSEVTLVLDKLFDPDIFFFIQNNLVRFE